VLGVIVSGFPRRSETFAMNELLALEAAGMLGPVFATKRGETCGLSPRATRLVERTLLLPDVGPERQAAIVADCLARCAVAGIHGYFAHQPAEVAMLAAQRLDVRHGFSVHARDARKVEPHDLLARARGAACVVACNVDVASELACAGVSPTLLPHGVDLSLFQARPLPLDGALHVLAVGRLVEKKGFLTLVDAVARVGLPLTLRIVGDGPERPVLADRIEALGLHERVTLCGARDQAELPGEYARAHVVVVPSVVDRSGDRDGLPNVVLEAMAMGRAVVASHVAAIATAVRDGVTGLLVPPGDSYALAEALRWVAMRPRSRESFGAAGRARVESEFDLVRCTDRLVGQLRAAYG
jgi:glycosyltransferase involved in cell wall biosynthesis